MHMNKTNKKKTTITEQRIESPKGFLLLCAIVALLSDIAVLAVLLMNVTELHFWICPLIIAVLDAVFLVSALFSNYRFAYAFKGVLVHIGLLVAVCVYAWLSTGYLESRIVFESIALYTMPAVHLVQCFAVFFNALHASKKGKLFRRVLAISLSLLFVLGAGLYANFLFTKGFFGQGFSAENRTLVYSYDEERGEYVVGGVLEGRGGQVVIPAEFNGRPVGAVDCTLFSNPELQTVQFDCAGNIRFENIDQMTAVSESLTLLAGKSEMDALRQSLYELVGDNAEALSLANRITPDDVGEGEVYISFRYSLEALQIAENEIIPTWFAPSGAVFDLAKHASEVSYVKHSNATNDEDMYYSYTEQQGMIFRAVRDGNGADINGFARSASTDVTVEFEKIWRISIDEDNDEKYTIADAYRFLETENGRFPYKLATEEHVGAVLSALPGRSGFTFAWQTGQDRHELTDLAAELASLDALGKDCLEMYPVWTLLPPTITSLTADGVASNHSALYGTDVVLASAAEAPDPSLSVSYSWSKQGELANTSTHTLVNLHPEDAGEYVLTVTAYSDTVTSLTSTASKKINVGFEKRELSFFWNLPVDTVYSAYDKPITAAQDAADVINDDTITFALSRDSVRDVLEGGYEINITLTGDAAKKYYVAAADRTRTVVITPYRVNVDWDEVISFEYNGRPTAPGATVTGLGSDGLLNITVSGEQQDVGEHRATVTTENKNYELAGNQVTYYITPRSISVSTWSAESLVYNGADQVIKVTALSNVVYGEDSLVLSGLIYYGQSTNVGDYTATVSLPEKSNYIFVGSTSQDFTITPKALTVTVSDRSTVYSGTLYTDFTFTSVGLAGSDQIQEVLSLRYKGEAVSAINVNAEGYTIDADIIGAEKLGNYAVTLNTGTLKIEKKALDIYLIDATKVYDGLVYPYESFTFRYEGLVSADSIEQVCTLNYTGNAVSAVAASSMGYELNAEQNAQSKYDNYTVTLHPAKLTITKAPLSVTAVGNTKVYDGNSASTTEFGVLVEGLVPGENEELLGAPAYSGAATSNKNVGVYTLSVKYSDNSATRNYEITYHTGTYEITKKDLTVTAIGGTKVYNGLRETVFDFEVSGLVDGETKSQLGTPVYGGAATGAINVNTYILTVTLPANSVTNNYDISYFEGQFIITPKSITVQAVGGEKIYDGKEGGKFNITVTNLASTDNISVLGTPVYGGNATSAVNVGSYTLTVTLPGNPNYQIDLYTPGVFQINPKSVTVQPTGGTRVYNGEKGGEFSFTATGLVSGETAALFGSPVYSGTAVDAVNAGSYSLTVSFPSYETGTQNYTLICRSGTLVINKKDLKVYAIGGNKIYDGTPGSGFGFEVNGLTGSDTKEMLGTPTYGGDAISNKNAGVHNLTVSLPKNDVTNNYSISYTPASFTISQKSLVITAYATDREYDGHAGRGFSYEIGELVAGDSEASFGAPTYGGNGATAVNVGEYTLTVSFPKTQTSDNYTITYVPATFQITKKALAVTAVAVDRVYNGSTGGGFSFKMNGLVPGDQSSQFGAPVYGGNAVNAVNVGTYELTVSFGETTISKNYEISYASTTFTITKRTLIVTAVATDRVYDGSTGGSFTFQMEGLATTDSESDFGVPVYGGSAVGAVEAGTYTLSVSFAESELSKNYEITYVADEGFVISEPATSAPSTETGTGTGEEPEPEPEPEPQP